MTDTSQDSLRIAFIGGGYIARRHRDALRLTGRVVINAVADPRAEVAAAFVSDSPTRVFSDHSRMLDSVAVDAVYVCVPPYAHGPIERSLVAHNLPFFVEKPLGVDLETPTEIARALELSAMPVAVGYHWRQTEAVREARRILGASTPYLAVGQWLDGLPGSAWWRHVGRSGGQLVEQATHIVDLCRMFLGEVTDVAAFESVAPTAAGGRAGGDVPAATVANLSFASGAVATLACTYCMPRRHRVEVEFLHDDVALLVSEERLRLTTAEGTEDKVFDDDPFLRQASLFLDAVGGGGSGSLVGYQDALNSHTIAFQLAAAARGKS